MPFVLESARPRYRSLAFAPILLSALVTTTAAGAASFLLSSCVDCSQGAGAVAGGPSGSFLAAWTGTTNDFVSAVPGRFFLPNGTPRGPDFLLSPAPAAQRGDVAVAAEATGFFAAAWSVRSGSNSEIIVQRFKRTLDPFGLPTQVSSDPPSVTEVDTSPSLTYMPDKGFVVVWERFQAPPSDLLAGDPEVMARRYDMRGHALSPSQRISSGPLDVGHTAVCADRAGTVFAAWTSIDNHFPYERHKRGIVLRRLTPNAGPLGEEIVVTPPLSAASEAALACGPSGFTVAWQSDYSLAGASSGRAILAQRYSAGGLPLGDPLAVSEATPGRISPPAASQDAAGNVVVSWTVNPDDGSSSREVMFRRIAADGTLGSAVLASRLVRSPAALLRPGVTHLGLGGDFVLVWPDQGTLIARRYSKTGFPLARASVPAASVAAGSVDQP